MPAEIGRYRVERVIGRGAMGVIYAAHDPVIDRKVAIKLIRADLLSGDDQADYVARFQREARAAGRCTHPNIVAIYDMAVHEGNPFLAMEYVEAENLGAVLARSARMPQRDAGAIIGQVLDALTCAHRLGIVHRDVKPANILVLSNGQVKMTDFGIARFDSSELTQDGSVVGTPSYMSPEQCRGDAVDARSDVFSAGVVLYEMLSGERPFPGRNFTEIIYRLVNEPLPDIRVKLDTVSASLAHVIERALAKQPSDRFPSADAMAAALRGSVEQGQQQQRDDHTVVLPRSAGPGSRTDLAARSRAGVGADEARRAEHELVRHLGPIARILVKRALESAGSADEFWRLLAAHITRDADRTAFLRRRI